VRIAYIGQADIADCTRKKPMTVQVAIRRKNKNNSQNNDYFFKKERKNEEINKNIGSNSDYCYNYAVSNGLQQRRRNSGRG